MEPAVIIFGERVDRFKLGMGVSEAIGIISNDYPRLNLEISFPKQEKVMSNEINICLLDWGIRLRFQPISQRLYLIDYYDICLRRFSIKGNAFGGDANQIVTFESIQRYLGPTVPGQLIEDENFLCNFGGASFLFAIPSEHLSGMKSHLPVTFSDGTSAPLSRIFIYPLELDLLTRHQTYPDETPVQVNVILKHSYESSLDVCVYINLLSRDTALVELGMSPQDIISMLGDPTAAGMNPNTSSYRYEYSFLGLEFYFSEINHKLFQIVIRNNLPHSADFGRFDRCPFRIYLRNPGDDLLRSSDPEALPVICSPSRQRKSVISGDTPASMSVSESSGPVEIDSITLKTGPKKKSSKRREAAEIEEESMMLPNPPSGGQHSMSMDTLIGPHNETAFINPVTSDHKVREIMSSWFGGPVLARDKSAQLPAPQGSPFADTLLYAYPENHICFEVTSTEPGSIVSVSLLDLDMLNSSSGNGSRP